MNKDYKNNPLDKYGRKIKKSKKKYKDGEESKKPRLVKRYNQPRWLEKEDGPSFPICEECGQIDENSKIIRGRIINPTGGFWVCEDCGLVHEQVYVSSQVNIKKEEGPDNYKNIRETPYRKSMRTDIQEKEVQKKMKPKIKSQIFISKDVHKELQEYCKKHNLVQWKFVSDIILEAILPEGPDDVEG